MPQGLLATGQATLSGIQVVEQTHIVPPTTGPATFTGTLRLEQTLLQQEAVH
jgi:hypothetical protein